MKIFSVEFLFFLLGQVWAMELWRNKWRLRFRWFSWCGRWCFSLAFCICCLLIYAVRVENIMFMNHH